jgi:hypothetical protein
MGFPWRTKKLLETKKEELAPTRGRVVTMICLQENVPEQNRQRLDGLGAREETAVNGINHGLGGDLPAAEEAAVQTLDGIFAALDAVELQVDVALRVGI